MQTCQKHTECRFDYYADADGPECVAVADWRAEVNNAGVDAPINEVKDLIARAPACLAAHGSPDDWGRFGLLSLAARADAPLTALMDLVAA
jgi:hypothetical protein